MIATTVDSAEVPLKHFTRAKTISGYSQLVRELGGSPEQLLAEAGIPADAIESALVMLPVDRVGQLLETTASRLGCPDLGMRLAERQSIPAIMRPLDRLYRTAPTVGDSLAISVRHTAAFNSALLMAIDAAPIEGLQIVDFKLLESRVYASQLIELLMLLTHNSVLWLSAGFAQSRRVWFSHLPIGSPAVYARRFNTTVEFGQEFDGLFLRQSDLGARIAGCDAERFISEGRWVQESFPARHQDIDMRVRQSIFRLLAEADNCTRHNVARALGLQVRTLNRRLSKIGTSFESIRDDVRRDLAFRYLARDDLPLTEIAGRLGYSELAVLSRCCRRWFGTTPRRLRQDLVSWSRQPTWRGEQYQPAELVLAAA